MYCYCSSSSLLDLGPLPRQSRENGSHAKQTLEEFGIFHYMHGYTYFFRCPKQLGAIQQLIVSRFPPKSLPKSSLDIDILMVIYNQLSRSSEIVSSSSIHQITARSDNRCRIESVHGIYRRQNLRILASRWLIGLMCHCPPPHGPRPATVAILVQRILCPDLDPTQWRCSLYCWAHCGLQRLPREHAVAGRGRLQYRCTVWKLTGPDCNAGRVHADCKGSAWCGWVSRETHGGIPSGILDHVCAHVDVRFCKHAWLEASWQGGRQAGLNGFAIES